MRFQRLSWHMQHAGWAGLGILVLAALLGLFSNGPLSWTTSEGAGGALQVDYQRVYRNGLDSQIELRIAGRPDLPEREVILSTGLLERIVIKEMQPQALRAEAGPDGLHLFFALAPSGESLVRLVLRPQESGAVEGTVALADLGDPAALDFLILP